MTWADLIIISVAVSLITVMKHLDTMPGYTCPQYCATDHEHFPLDLQSDLKEEVDKNVKLNKINELASK
tara:strand:+ start:6318 stop:6524 length:207 start_codon:yes stop_codon:yes gene_type:complete